MAFYRCHNCGANGAYSVPLPPPDADNDRCGSCRAGGSKRDAHDIGARGRPPMNVHRRLQCRSCRQPFYQRFMLTRESSEYRLACPRCEGVAAYWLPGDPLGQPTGNVGVTSEEPE